MMECQSTDSGGSEDVSESVSNESLNHDSGDNSTLTSGCQQSCHEQMPAVLPCGQAEQMSVTGCQLDLQTANEAQMIVSFCDSKQQPPELYTDANEELEQINNDKIPQPKEQSQLFGSVSEDLSVLVSTSAILEHRADMGDEELQNSSHPSHPCQNLLINTSLSVNNYNIAGESDNIQQGVTLLSDEIHCETSRNTQEKCSNDEFKQDKVGYSHEPSSECHVYSNQLHQQDADDDVVEQLLQQIDTFGHSPELCSSDRSLADHQADDRRFLQEQENEECDQLSEHHSNDELSPHRDNHSRDSQLLDGSNSGSQLSDGGASETDNSSQNTVNEGIAIFTAEQIMPDQLPAAYNVLVHRYLLLRQHRSEQLALQRQMEEDHQAISARLASVIVERDRYLTKLEEFQDFSLADLEEVKQVSDFSMLIYNHACN